MIYKFFNNAIYLFVIEVFIRLKAVVALPLLVRFLDPASFGAYSQFMVMASLLSPIVIMGSDYAATKFLADVEKRKLEGKFVAWIIFLLVSSGLISSICYVFQEFLGQHFFSDYHFGTELFLLSLCFASLNVFVIGLRHWFKFVDESIVWGSLGGFQAATSLAAVVLSFKLDYDLLEFVKALIVSEFLTALFTFLLIYRRGSIVRPDFSSIIRLVKYGLPLAPVGFSIWSLNYVDRIILLKYETLEILGVYAVSYTVGSMAVQVLMGPIWSMYFSTAAILHQKNEKHELKRLFESSVNTILIVTMPTILFLVLFGGQILYHFAGSDFVFAAPLLWVIALSYLISMLSSYCEVNLNLNNKQIVSTFAVCIALISNILMNILLIPNYGLLGAGAATLISFVAQLIFVLTMLSYHRLFEFDLRNTLKIIFSFGVLNLFAFAGHSLLVVQTTIGNIVMFSLVTLCFFGSLMLSGVIELTKIPIFSQIFKNYKFRKTP